MPLYHSTGNRLKPSDVIAPGNWGKVIAERGFSHPSFMREQWLEQVRQKSFPDKPSRFKSTFSCSSLETAEFYRNVWVARGNKPTADHLYEVEKVDPNAIEHRADFNVVEPLPGLNANMDQIAELYWTSSYWVSIAGHPGMRCEEVVTPSPLRVVRRL